MGDERQTNLGFFLLCILSLLFLASVANAQPTATTAAGTITAWEMSRPYPANRVDRDSYPSFLAIFGANWEGVTPEPSGFLDFSKLSAPGDGGPNLVMIRTIVRSDRTQNMILSLHYRARVDLFVNGAKVFSGSASEVPGSPENPGSTENVDMRLERGLNEIFMMVTETAAGWRVTSNSNVELRLPIEEHHRLTKAWETEDVLLTPESVLYDSERQTLYVTSYDIQFSSKPEPSGYISRLSLDGDIEELQWVSGLNAPTGMGIHDGHLYTLERRFLTEISLESGEVVERYPIPDVEFPNDLSIDLQGDIYITDTRPSSRADSRVYRFSNGEFEIWLDEGIDRSNGAFVYDNTLLVGNSGDGFLKSVDLATRETTKVISMGAGVIDGIRVANDGSYLVSHWAGQVYQISPELHVIEILDLMGERLNTADFEFVKDRNLLVIPTFLGNRVVAYRLR